jgi:hypothetical protein
MMYGACTIASIRFSLTVALSVSEIFGTATASHKPCLSEPLSRTFRFLLTNDARRNPTAHPKRVQGGIPAYQVPEASSPSRSHS